MEPVKISPQELSNLIGLIYESAFEAPQWKRFLNRMGQLFPGSSAHLFGHENNRLFPAYAGNDDMPENLRTSSIEVDFLNYQQNNALTAQLNAPNGFIGRTLRHADHDSYEKSQFFNDLMAPYGYHHFINLKLDSHNDRGAFMVFPISADPEIQAATHDPMFEVLKLLAPHAVRALQMVRALTMARNALGVMGGLLDSIVLPMIVVTAQGEMVFANTAGQRLLARADPIQMTAASRITLNDPHDADALAAKLRAIDEVPAAQGLSVAHEGGSLALCLTPFRPSMAAVNPLDRDLLQDERLIAVFVGQTGPEAINAGLLQDVYELTPREADVCIAIMAGQSPAQIAAASGRSLKTVRNQVQAIHDKVGVGSNTELTETLSVFRTVGAIFDGKKPHLLA